jgi:hypothetical protein
MPIAAQVSHETLAEMLCQSGQKRDPADFCHDADCLVEITHARCNNSSAVTQGHKLFARSYWLRDAATALQQLSDVEAAAISHAIQKKAHMNWADCLERLGIVPVEAEY